MVTGDRWPQMRDGYRWPQMRDGHRWPQMRDGYRWPQMRDGHSAQRCDSHREVPTDGYRLHNDGLTIKTMFTGDTTVAAC
ncbi:hypothetical protein Hamer_G025721 [Homarus americanus]|uniref:Uncharacterized protein n=1 Tax=Homarus americanus TaxID=6706 RepID=A0A8J5JAI9_HOMAM|nr:hypothetical protein Hamer_G025721 [Homarus americanus]